MFPRVGDRPVSEVNTADVLEILWPIWHVKAATAREVRQRIRAVLEWPIALDMRNDNPCDRVMRVLGPQNDIVTHRQALPHKDVAAAIETVRESKSGQPAVKLAFEFLVLTAARSGRSGSRRGTRWTRRARVDRPGLADEGEARAPRSAVRERAGDPRRGAGARRRQRPRVPDADGGGLAVDAAEDAPVPRDCRRPAWIPFVVPGLGGGGDDHPRRSSRSHSLMSCRTR